VLSASTLDIIKKLRARQKSGESGKQSPVPHLLSQQALRESS